MKHLCKVFICATAAIFALCACSDEVGAPVADCKLPDSRSAESGDSSVAYTYYYSERVPVSIDNSKKYVIVRDNSTVLSTNAPMKAPARAAYKGYIVDASTLDNPDAHSVLSTSSSNKIVAIEDVTTGGTPLNNFVYVGLKSESDLPLLERLAEEIGCKVNGSILDHPKWIEVEIGLQSAMTSIGTSCYLYENGNFDFVDPGFEIEYKTSYTPTDPFFGKQWNLAGSTYSINMYPAWRITKGSPDITLAIADNGMNTSLTDFEGRMSGYSYENSLFEDHGTRVASIAAASHNSFGIAGVAPLVTLMNLNISNKFNPTEMLESSIIEALTDAYKNGADVINCSWGAVTDLFSILMEEAINETIEKGRNGKGCVVVFAAGNDGTLDYPGRKIQKAILVGSINSRGYLDTKTAFGEALTVVAPGAGVYSLDKNGLADNTDSGTSYAAPHVSGLASLILSIRPELTTTQVKQLIIETSSSSAHSLEFGWGLINAGDAMLAANEDYSISSNSDIIYPTNGLLTFYLHNVPRGASVSWSSEKGSGPYSASHKSASFRYPTNTATPIKETITVTISYLGRTKTIKYPCTIYMATQISAITKLEDFPDNDYYVHLQAHCSKNNAPVEWSIYSSNGYQFNLMDFMYEGDASYIDNPKAYATLQIGNGMSGIMDQIPEGAYCKIEVRVNEPGGDQRFCTVIRQGGTWIVRDDGMSPMSLKEEKEAIE
jgi:subtilisin family serine protease